MNELLKIMKNRHSVRKYSGEKVPDEMIDMILKAGLLSPSGRAVKPWEFIVIRDKIMLKKLVGARTGAANMLSGADCAIVVIADKSKTDVWVEDCSIAMTQMHLMADSLGLGSCWIQGRNRESFDGQTSCKYIQKLLEYPDSFELEAILSIGWPIDKRPPYEEPNSEDSPKIHRERF